ncbi:MAG: peptidoglycan DD-metalloendopeptidase family protein [Eubacteriales bacterium]|nr:peptidoglycan DD-metalloendopeptidase family protein [Eubacteriales bacterium]
MQKKRILSIVLSFILALGMTLQVQASSISETKKEGDALKAQKSAVEAEKAALAEQLNTLITDLEKTNADVEAKQQEIAENQTELIKAEIDEQQQYESMKMRIKYMYENGNTQFIEILLESKSIGEFLNNAEYINKISEYDRNMLVEFQKIVQDVKDKREKLEQEEAELVQLQQELQTKKEEINTLIAEKAQEIGDLNIAIGENAKKLEELQAAAAEQLRLQQEAQQAANNGSSSGGASSSPRPSIPVSGNGALGNPCPSAYISSEFGGRQSPGGIGSTNHKGRDYAAASGSPIYASASGTVVTAGYNAARGNYVVVSHSGGLSTLYQHCSALYVSVGQSVSAGQNIAAVGNTGYSTGPHLHFEVWVNGTPVDPRLYL